MIDIHAHILPGIDDGSRSMDESIEILKKASSCGVTDIFVTPHYITGSKYMANNATKKELLSNLKREIKKRNIDIKLYLGNEVFIENNMLELKDKDQIYTLNNGKYLLFELPLNYEFNGILDVIFNLRCKKIIPIIAHPERYAFLKKNPVLVHDLIDAGALLQCNIGSFFGMYGNEAKKTVMLFLKHNMITFISSDIHRRNNTMYEKIDELKKLLKQFISEEEIDNLLGENARRIINKEVIEVASYTPIKKGFFKKWK